MTVQSSIRGPQFGTSGVIDLRFQKEIVQQIEALTKEIAELKAKIVTLEAAVLALEGKTKAGQFIVEWPGGSQFTNTVGVAHKLGVLPTSASVSLGVATDGGIENVVGITNLSATEIQARAFRTTGAPGAGVKTAVFWIVTK